MEYNLNWYLFDIYRSVIHTSAPVSPTLLIIFALCSHEEDIW